MHGFGKWQRLRELTFGFFIVLIILSSVLYFFLKDDLSLEEFHTAIGNFGIWAPAIFIVFFIVGSIFIPSTPFMVAAGIFFGLKYGFIYTMIGGISSALLSFIVSRSLGKNWAESILQKDYMKRLDGYNKRLEDGGAIWDLAFLRLIPMPFNVLNILMGVSRISLKDYSIGTLLGLVPSNIIAVYAGVVLSKIF